MKNPRNSSQRLALLSLSVLLVVTAACKSAPSSGAKRYGFKGKVISVDKNARTANIDNEPIPGFMDPMVMPYTVKPPAMLDQLQPGDTITADVVVQQTDNSYWLENVKVTGHSTDPAAKPTSALHIPSPGDEVPDFNFINQNAQRISLHQYRGQTLLLTLIYTRCPFPDFCPRISHEFAAIDRQVRAEPLDHRTLSLEVPLELVFGAYRLAARVLWDEVIGQPALLNDVPPSTVIGVTSTVLEYFDDISAAVGRNLDMTKIPHRIS